MWECLGLEFKSLYRKERVGKSAYNATPKRNRKLWTEVINSYQNQINLDYGRKLKYSALKRNRKLWKEVINSYQNQINIDYGRKLKYLALKCRFFLAWLMHTNCVHFKLKKSTLSPRYFVFHNNHGNAFILLFFFNEILTTFKDLVISCIICFYYAVYF